MVAYLPDPAAELKALHLEGNSSLEENATSTWISHLWDWSSLLLLWGSKIAWDEVELEDCRPVSGRFGS